MKFAIENANWVCYAIKDAGRAIPSRLSHQILGNLLVELDADKQRAYFTGCDLNYLVRVWIPAETKESGTFLLPYKLSSELFSKLGSDNLFITVEDEKVKIQSGKNKYEILQGGNPDEFPKFKTLNGSTTMFDKNHFLLGLKMTLFAASPDNSKQVLNGININDLGGDNKISFAATDGHRLSSIDIQNNMVGKFPFENLTVSINQIGNTLAIIEQIKKGAEFLQLTIDDNDIQIDYECVTMVMRKLEGTYPNYRVLISDDIVKEVVVNIQDLMDSVSRCRLFSSSNLVKLTMPDNSNPVEMGVYADGSDIGNGYESITSQLVNNEVDLLSEAEKGIPVKASNTVCFDANLLLDGLKALKALSNEVKMSFRGLTRPCTITPIGAINDIDYTYLVMPVHLRK